MGNFKIPNNIFSLGLTAKELYCYIYLNSIYTSKKRNFEEWITVKQSTIARKCNIKTEQTVSRIITSLIKKGFITSAVRRKDTLNGTLGTYSYIIKKPSFDDGFFFMDRKIFDFDLTSKQVMVYLFMCKAFSVEIGFSWNSYNDIAKTIRLKRSDVVKAVKELVLLGLITKQTIKSRKNKRVYVDNHYFIVRFISGTIFKKPYKRPQKRRAPSPQRKALITNSQNHCNIKKRKSQGFLIEYDPNYELNPEYLIMIDIIPKLLETKIPKPKKKPYTKSQQEAIIALALNLSH